VSCLFINDIFDVTCRLAEANLQPISRDILLLYESEGRRAVADAVSAGLLAAAAEGPRATEQFAAVAAVCVSALAAAARAQDISARFLELLVARLEQVGSTTQHMITWRYNSVHDYQAVQCAQCGTKLHLACTAAMCWL